MCRADIRREPLCAALLLRPPRGPGRAGSRPAATMYATTTPGPPGVCTGPV